MTNLRGTNLQAVFPDSPAAVDTLAHLPLTSTFIAETQTCYIDDESAELWMTSDPECSGSGRDYLG